MLYNCMVHLHVCRLGFFFAFYSSFIDTTIVTAEIGIHDQHYTALCTNHNQ